MAQVAITVSMLKNEAETARLAWKQSIIDKDPQEHQDVVREAYMSAKTRAEALAEADAEEARVSDIKTPTASEMRDASDADRSDDVPDVGKDRANKAPSNYVELVGKHGTQYVPFATKTTEGFIKGFPAAVQLPDILRRYGPGTELYDESAKQNEAFSLYIRKGPHWVTRERPDLAPHLKALQEGTDSEGGYLVPTDQRTDVIFDPGAPGGVTRPQSLVSQTSRDAGTMPTWTDGDWIAIAEEATPTNTDPVFGQLPFTARKSGANITVSEELLMDSATNLPALFGARWNHLKGTYEDQQAIEGDGSAEPLGLRTTGAPQGDVADITDLLTLAAPTVPEIINAYFELPAQFRTDAIWNTTSSFMGRIAGLESANGGTAFLRELFAAPEMRLLGLPVVMFDGTGWDDAAAIAANEEVGAIGSYRRFYQFVDRIGMTIRRFDETLAASDQVLFRARARYDSFFTENNAFRILKGATS